MELDEVILDPNKPWISIMISKQVSSLASSTSWEFQRLIWQGCSKGVVAVLEDLDSVCCQAGAQVELKLLKKDNEKLVTQYEREEALKAGWRDGVHQKPAKPSYIRSGWGMGAPGSCQKDLKTEDWKIQTFIHSVLLSEPSSLMSYATRMIGWKHIHVENPCRHA